MAVLPLLLTLGAPVPALFIASVSSAAPSTPVFTRAPIAITVIPPIVVLVVVAAATMAGRAKSVSDRALT
jgi:hypothetical protein